MQRGGGRSRTYAPRVMSPGNHRTLHQGKTINKLLQKDIQAHIKY